VTTGPWQSSFGTAPLVIDGGLSTQLAGLGEDVSGRLWTARVLVSNPQVVTRAHRDFIEAGARVVITASYQVSRRGFEDAGFTRAGADEALRASTRAARDAVEAVPGSGALVAASVGPFGAVLHDGSEYRGRYGRTIRQLADFHRERLDVIADTRPDLLAIETIPDADEAAAIVDVLTDHPDLPAWLAFSALDDAHVCAGQTIEEAVATAASAPSVIAVGINCTDPRHVSGLVARIRASCDLPIVVYPNSGGARSGAAGALLEPADAFSDHAIARWVASGVHGVGGCCGTDASTVRRIAGVLARPGG
jgi:homocysteine S-methyltransferase